MKKILILSLITLPLVLNAVETANPNMVKRDFLMKEYAEPGVASAFKAGADWFPYPAYEDRTAWDRLFGESKEKFIESGEQALDYKWEHVPATAFLEFERSGDRTVMQTIDAHNLVSFSSLVFADLAIALHFFKESIDKIDPSISYCAREAIRRNIEEPFLDDSKDKENWWLSIKLRKDGIVNNWNPWCNFNSLFCALLLQEDQATLDRMVRKSLFSVDQYLNYVKEDGACEEGPAYWSAAGARVYEYLQLLYNATGGRFDIFDNKMIKDMGEYICRARIGGPYVVNFADAAARLGIDSYMLWKYGNSVKSREMMDMALYGCARDDRNGFVTLFPKDNESARTLENLRWRGSLKNAVDSLNSLSDYPAARDALLESIPDCTWYPQTEFCFLRTRDNWFFGAKGGFNEESHNHNDVGSFVLYMDSQPVFVDAGVGIYSRKTFSGERYSIWSMQSDWHSLPLINGASQVNGRQYKSNDVSFSGKGSGYVLSMDIRNAYADTASCRSWYRTYNVNNSSEGSSITITDKYNLSGRILPDTENFLVKGKVLLPGDEFEGKMLKRGELVILCDGNVRVKMKFPSSLKASAEYKQLTDGKMRSNWGESLCRVSLVSGENAPLRGEYRFVITRI